MRSSDGWRVAFAPVTLIGLIHIVNGISVVADANSAKVSGLSGLYYIGITDGPLGILLLVIGAMAVTARVHPGLSRIQQHVLIAPQQTVLTIQLAGVAFSLWNGAYPDGYVPVPGNWWASFWFILSDQAALIFLCLSHTLDVALAPAINRLVLSYQKDLAYAKE